MKIFLAALAIVFTLTILSNSAMAQSAPAASLIDTAWYASFDDDTAEETFQIDFVDDKTIEFIEKTVAEGAEPVEKKWVGKIKISEGDFTAKFDGHTVGDQKVKAELSFTGHCVREPGASCRLRIIRSTDRRLLPLVWSNEKK